jgi:hypothetical protein
LSRWIGFLIAIGIGASLGLLYGWIINPVDYVETAPNTLRIDYKTDYVLMVAEAYRNENDLALALRRLAYLGDTPPDEMITQAITFAQQAGYLDNDRKLMTTLLTALQAYRMTQETPSP